MVSGSDQVSAGIGVSVWNNNERLWLLGKVGGRYDESVGTIEVID
jgi:hypothetical protein